MYSFAVVPKQAVADMLGAGRSMACSIFNHFKNGTTSDKIVWLVERSIHEGLHTRQEASVMVTYAVWISLIRRGLVPWLEDWSRSGGHAFERGAVLSTLHARLLRLRGVSPIDPQELLLAWQEDRAMINRQLHHSPDKVSTTQTSDLTPNVREYIEMHFERDLLETAKSSANVLDDDSTFDVSTIISGCSSADIRQTLADSENVWSSTCSTQTLGAFLGARTKPPPTVPLIKDDASIKSEDRIETWSLYSIGSGSPSHRNNSVSSRGSTAPPSVFDNSISRNGSFSSMESSGSLPKDVPTASEKDHLAERVIEPSFFFSVCDSDVYEV
jgi:hypothetical protein